MSNQKIKGQFEQAQPVGGYSDTQTGQEITIFDNPLGDQLIRESSESNRMLITGESRVGNTPLFSQVEWGPIFVTGHDGQFKRSPLSATDANLKYGVYRVPK